MTPEILDLVVVAEHENERGEDVPCWWVVCVALGGARYLVDVRLENGRHEITGWHRGEDDTNAPARSADDLDEDVSREVDDYMFRGR